MTKYNEEFKRQLVEEYVKGPLGFRRLARKHGLSNASPIKLWVRSYETFGEEGLRKKQTKQVYTVQLKLDVFHFMKQIGASYQNTAVHFEMNNLSIIANWDRKFLVEG